MKVVIAEFIQETNSFSQIPSDRKLFEGTSPILYGNEILQHDTERNEEMSGVLLRLRQYEDICILPAISARCVSGGRVTEEMFNDVASSILTLIRNNNPVDAIVLCLHGAMMCSNTDDAEGTLLELVRKEAGPSVIISVSLDLHSNITKRMIDNANALVGYHTYPHIDLKEVGDKAAEIAVESVLKRRFPVTALCKIPMIIMGEGGQTSEGPMHDVIEFAEEIQKEEDILYASAFQVQPWLDTPEIGCAATVTANNIDKASEEALKLCKYYWGRRGDFKAKLYSMDEIAEIVSCSDKPVVIGDAADGTGSGSAGDSNFVIRELVANYPEIRACVTVTDPLTVKDAFGLGVGVEKEFSIGGKLTEMYEPLSLRCKVLRLYNGNYIWRGPQHKGTVGHMGDSAILQCGNIQIIVTSISAFNWDPGVYLDAGIPLEEMQLIITKSPNAFREAYKDITDKLFVIDAPGISSSNPFRIPFTKILHPMFPYDDVDSLNPEDFLYKPAL